jgi:hypothetical protein
MTVYQVERNNNDYYKKILEDNHIYIPDRYYQPLVQSGLIEQLTHIILNVNEKLLNSKRPRYNTGGDDNDEPDHKYRRIFEEINSSVSTTPATLLSKSPTPTYTEHMIVDEDFYQKENNK